MEWRDRKNTYSNRLKLYLWIECSCVIVVFNLLNYIILTTSDSVTCHMKPKIKFSNFWFCRLEFPIVLVVYQDIFISVHGVNVLIGFVDRHLFCSSDDLLETFNSPASPYCTFSGIYVLKANSSNCHLVVVAWNFGNEYRLAKRFFNWKIGEF